MANTTNASMGEQTMSYGTVQAEKMTTESGYSLGAGNASSFKNRIINGGMTIAQRSTSNTPTAANFTYSIDRFFTAINSGTSGFTVSQLSQASTGLAGFYNALRFQRDSGTTNTTTQAFGQTIETENCFDLAGQSVTLSFWARAGSNFSASSSTITARLATGTGTNQGSAGAYQGTWTGYAQTNTTVAITTSWARYSVTYAVGAGVNEIQTLFYWSGSGTAGANDYIDITGVQLEVGTVATSFDFRSISTELDLCYRYCFAWRTDSLGYTNYGRFPVSFNTSTTECNTDIFFPKPMRTTAYSLSWNNKAYQEYFVTGGGATGSSISLNTDANGINWINIRFTGMVGSSLTTGGLSGIRLVNVTDGALIISTEL
jgi:hypothetical protein